MLSGGGVIASGYEGCIFYPKLNIDEMGHATDSDDFTKVTKVYNIESSFANERDTLIRVNTITGSRGVIDIIGTDVIKSFPEEVDTNGCGDVKERVKPLNLTTDAEGNEFLDGANLTILSPMVDKYIDEGEKNGDDWDIISRELHDLYNTAALLTKRLRVTHFVKDWIKKYKRYKIFKISGKPLEVYCIHQTKITSNIDKHILRDWVTNHQGLKQEKWPMQNFRDAFEALLKTSHNNIIHHDLSQVNIFHNKTIVLIGDWGLSVDILSDDIFERKFSFFDQFYDLSIFFNFNTDTFVDDIHLQLYNNFGRIDKDKGLNNLCQKLLISRNSQVSSQTIFCTGIYFTWSQKDVIIHTLRTIYAKHEGFKDAYLLVENIINYVSLLKTKEEMKVFLKLVMKHSDLKIYIQQVSPLIDISEEQCNYLINQFKNFENYDSFYEILSVVEGKQVNPSEDIIPILAEKRNQIINIIGHPRQGGGRKNRKIKLRTVKRKYRKRFTRTAK